MLPEVFRTDDPVLQVPLALEHQLKLEQLLDGLPAEVFTASDSLGWCYQFWQAERKDQVNKAGNKIGADELPAVTQLFTEDYTVDFLLDNTLGAWWAGKKLTAEDVKNAEFKSEEELRRFCALPACRGNSCALSRARTANGLPPPARSKAGPGRRRNSSAWTRAWAAGWKPALQPDRLRAGMERLYRLFQQAPVLGSLINPRAGEGDLLVAAFHELQPLLEKALAQETKDDTAHEMAVTARGLAKAAEILAGQFTLVATNVPHLGRRKQGEVLKDYCERFHSEAKRELATCFIERSLAFCASGGSAALLVPQNWLFLGTFQALREKLLSSANWDFVCRMGSKAFQTPMYEFGVAMHSFTKTPPRSLRA
jgi:hypothetical protein